MSQVQSFFLLLIFLLLLVTMEGYWGTAAAAAPTSTSKPIMKIGVPVESPCHKYVRVICNQTSNKCFDGYSVRLFKLILRRLRYKEPYQFLAYNGTYDSIVKQVHLKKFDAVVGDVSIVANRTQYVDFSRHYTEMGVRMVVHEEPESGKAWLFVKPFTKALWALTGAVFLYNGVIIWLIEKAGNEELKGSSFCSQVGNLVWLSLNTLFPIHGEKLRSNLSRATMVVWLFVALVLTQSYTANLTSMLTVTRLRPGAFDVETLRKSTDKIGCDHGSFVIGYLKNVMHFNESRIQTYLSAADYAQDLRSGKIKAAFLELAFIKIFLDEYKKGFAVTGPTYEIGGYGFAFAKGSPLVGNVSDEILRLRESGELHQLEEHLVSSPSKSSLSSGQTDDQESGRLSTDSFGGLFLITGGTSTVAFLLFLVSRFQCQKKQQEDQRVPEQDHVTNLDSSKKALHAVEGNAIHDPDWWDDEVQLGKFRRSNTL